ncbi:MAG: HD domain-containing phosphohydrolase [Sporolactobacillus sp.]
MRVETHHLKPGSVLKEDVYAKASNPLMKAGTKLTEEHIAFLKAFLIEAVNAEPSSSLSSYARRRNTDSIEKQTESRPLVPPPVKTSAVQSAVQLSGDANYQLAQATYKTSFRNWQSGGPIDIWALRKVVIPLLEEGLANSFWLSGYLTSDRPVRTQSDRSLAFGLLAAFLAKKMDEPQGDVLQYGLVGLLADASLAKQSPVLLDKREDELLDHERKLFERHPLDSYNMLKNVTSLRHEFVQAVAGHHEREDGSGYPLHLNGAQLDRPSKYLAVCCELLQRMRMRPGSGSIIPALDWMENHTFDKLSKILFRKLESELMTLFIGARVRLSDQRTGKITFIDEANPTMPIVALENGDILQLSTHRTLKIISVV